MGSPLANDNTGVGRQRLGVEYDSTARDSCPAAKAITNETRYS